MILNVFVVSVETTEAAVAMAADSNRSKCCKHSSIEVKDSFNFEVSFFFFFFVFFVVGPVAVVGTAGAAAATVFGSPPVVRESLLFLVVLTRLLG